MSDTIFTKIIKREIPAHIIYEDDNVIAFLDIHATTPGHTLVVPKVQVDQIWDLPVDTYQILLEVTRKIARHLRTKLDVARVGIKLMGDEVSHVHIHLIPFNDIEEYNNSPDGSVEPDHDALASLAKQLILKENS